MDVQMDLKPNQLVNIEILEKTGVSSRYPSRVENIGDQEIVLASPIKNRVAFFVPPGSDINVWYWDKIAIYTFTCKVIRNINKDIPLLTVEKPQKIEKVQKRDHVRIRISIDVFLSYTDKNGELKEIWCKTRDISGGGMMLVLHKPLLSDIDELVNMEFKLDSELIQTKGKVVRNSWESDSDGVERNIVGVEFKDLANKNTQVIIQYVFQKQIELRRKGLL